nr:hypothetical protein [Angustibacter aerolatus]
MAEDDRPAPPPSGVAVAREDDTAAQFDRMLRGSALPTLAVGVAAVVVSAFWGAKPAWSAAIGAALVLVFFSLSLLVMRATAHLEPTVVMAVVLGVYTAKARRAGRRPGAAVRGGLALGSGAGRHDRGLHAGLARLRDAGLHPHAGARAGCCRAGSGGRRWALIASGAT